MSRFFIILSFTTLIGLGLTAEAQLDIKLEADRDTYLLFEPMLFDITLQNQGTTPLALSDHPVTGRPWLSFQIFAADGSKISSTGKFSVPPQVLEPGQQVSLQVNITPLYSIRSTGRYDMRASVEVPGGRAFLTGKIRFFVGKGEEVWREQKPINGNIRVYSLIRFLEQGDSSLYLRVEEPDTNLVYATTRLGSVVGFSRPQVRIDPSGQVHVLHVSTSNLHRYTLLGADGTVLKVEDLNASTSVPRLVDGNDGSVSLAGGVNVQNIGRRRRLSEDQAGL